MTYWFYDSCKAVLRVTLRLGFGFHISGLGTFPPSGPVIVAANHLSYLDPPVLGAAAPRRLGFMARANLFDHPILGAVLRGLHVIPLEQRRGDVGAIREAVGRLRRGDVVAIFPEGKRQRSGQLGAAQRGVGLLAVAGRAPIVPVLIRGTFQALPPDAHWVRHAKIRVAFGEPISYTTASVVTPQPPAGEPVRRGGDAHVRQHYEALAEAVTRAWHRLEEQLHDHCC